MATFFDHYGTILIIVLAVFGVLVVIASTPNRDGQNGKIETSDWRNDPCQIVPLAYSRLYESGR